MPQKIVISVPMASDKCRSKALALVAATYGVESVALAGDAKDQVEVVGDVDSVRLTAALRKKIGPARLVLVGDAKKEAEKKKKEDEKKKQEEYAHSGYYYCAPPPMPVVYEQHPCSIL